MYFLLDQKQLIKLINIIIPLAQIYHINSSATNKHIIIVFNDHEVVVSIWPMKANLPDD